MALKKCWVKVLKYDVLGLWSIVWHLGRVGSRVYGIQDGLGLGSMHEPIDPSQEVIVGGERSLSPFFLGAGDPSEPPKRLKDALF